ncbi:outer membrane lipoprotein-sorting protein [Marisediminicola sp. UYEF4]|uniref:LolA family protein n=1 Tax=Marisediminicola sp. UYEF4 TaxID=1756384 RepID=UPI003399C3DD
MNSRWLPAAIIPAVIVGGAILAPLGATAAVDLPDVSPGELLELVATSDVDAFSGTMEQKSALGLPDLSGVSGPRTGSEPDISSALELLTGSHTARVFVNGPDLARVQVFDQLAERNVVRNGGELWVYDSSDRTATHVLLPADYAEGAAKSMPDAGAAPTPGELADRVLAELDPTTVVTVGTDATVAGRPAYELVLTPRDTQTLVGSVSIAVDSGTGLPLAFEIVASGQDAPAFRVAFTQLTLESPDDDLFAFAPPPGATVTEYTVRAGPKPDADTAEAPDHTVSGEGWSSIVELPAADLPAGLVESPVYTAATEPVDGGRLLSTALVNVLLTDDGRVFAGAVSPEQLLDAAIGR